MRRKIIVTSQNRVAFYVIHEDALEAFKSKFDTERVTWEEVPLGYDLSERW